MASVIVIFRVIILTVIVIIAVIVVIILTVMLVTINYHCHSHYTHYISHLPLSNMCQASHIPTPPPVAPEFYVSTKKNSYSTPSVIVW